MEAIREYLSNMFMSLPETPEVLRAKAELMEMMEDKYEELIREGKSEKEAVGIVISEFGNLEELAKELGIDRYMEKNMENSGTPRKSNQEQKKQEKREKNRYQWGFNDVKGYIEYAWKHAGCIAAGVLLCIWAPYIDCVMEGAYEAGYISSWAADAIGTICLFGMVAFAVGLFCGASGMKKRYGNVSRFSIVLDEKAAHYIEQKGGKDEQVRLTMRITGVALCILSVVPSSVNCFDNELLSEMMDSSVLVIVGIGVLLLVLSASVNNRYKELKKALINEGSGSGIPFPCSYQKKGMPVAAILILVFAGFLVVAGGSAAMFLMPAETQISSESIEGSYDISDVDKIMIDVDLGGVNVEMADVEQLQFRYSGGSKYAPVVSCENGEFRITEKRRMKWFHFNFGLFRTNRGDRTVTILIPRQRMDLVYQIEVDAGNIKLKDLHAKKAVFDVDAGELEGTGCVFEEKSTVEVDAGNVTFENSVFHILEGDVDAGNFFYESAVPLSYYDMDMDVDMGEINVNGKKVGGAYKSAGQNASAGEYRLTLEADMGNLTVSETSGLKQ